MKRDRNTNEDHAANYSLFSVFRFTLHMHRFVEVLLTDAIHRVTIVEVSQMQIVHQQPNTALIEFELAVIFSKILLPNYY